jgi:hypothetical protein
VELLLHLLLATRGSVLVLKPLPSIKIWYAFGVLSKKKSDPMPLFDILEMKIPYLQICSAQFMLISAAIN